MKHIPYYADPDNLLHIDGNWDLVKSIGFNGVSLSLIVHHCKATGYHPIRYYKDTYHLPCNECKEEVPEEIQGLWVLHNWDMARNSPTYLK